MEGGQHTEIDGRTLENLRKDAGLTQKVLAERAGVTKFTVSRWCQDGRHRVRTSNVEGIATALGMTLEEFTERVEEAPEPEELTEAERDWLEVYRTLPPLLQARAGVHLEEFIQEQASRA